MKTKSNSLKVSPVNYKSAILPTDTYLILQYQVKADLNGWRPDNYNGGDASTLLTFPPGTNAVAAVISSFSNAGDQAELIWTLAGLTATGVTLYVSNPSENFARHGHGTLNLLVYR